GVKWRRSRRPLRVLMSERSLMTTKSLDWREEAAAPPAEHPQGEVREGLPPVNGTNGKAEHHLHTAVAGAPSLNGNGVYHDVRPALALFCYEDPGSFIGQYASQLVRALARRHTPVHLFARHAFEVEAPGVTVHAVGTCDDGDLLGQVHEFARRACNAFLQEF